MSKTYVSLKYQIQYSYINCDKLLAFKRRFRDSQIVIITNFVVVSNVGIIINAVLDCINGMFKMASLLSYTNWLLLF